ncbi:hypothetical protein A3K93_12760 [Acinetobacter sp. NCu2D-2]|nr:hypothetical protein A3K93_12760 [Acinetobacter sp. NCu2D-2]
MFELKDLITGSFGPMARDCVANLELNQRMLKSLHMIQHNVPEQVLQQAAEEMAVEILQRCLKHLDFQPDQDVLLQEFQALFPKQFARLSTTEDKIHTTI